MDLYQKVLQCIHVHHLTHKSFSVCKGASKAPSLPSCVRIFFHTLQDYFLCTVLCFQLTPGKLKPPMGTRVKNINTSYISLTECFILLWWSFTKSHQDLCPSGFSLIPTHKHNLLLTITKFQTIKTLPHTQGWTTISPSSRGSSEEFAAIHCTTPAVPIIPPCLCDNCTTAFLLKESVG